MKDWISAARLRTLPLALASILMGAFLAQTAGAFRWHVFIWAAITTVLLQILSNFSNDYGDTLNGADTHERVGPLRAVQSGRITQKQMLNGIIILALSAFFSGIYLLYISFDGFDSKWFWIFLMLGILSIIAAYTYTAGKKPYGYMGLGDLATFLFFGPVGVAGSYFLFRQELSLDILLPAGIMGFFSTGVLNINNIRDVQSDKKAGKNTIPVKIGRKNAIIYHWILLSLIILFTLIFIWDKKANLLFLLSFPLILLNGYQISKKENPDPYLKTLALTAVLFVILFGLSLP